jgi:RNA polymerase sigma factor (sigma-70 family)
MRTEPTDQELLGSLNADPAAFELFYRRHVDRVVGFAARRLPDAADVADVVATTFLTVLTSSASYDPQRGEPTAWLLGITHRLIAGSARRSRKHAALVTKIAGSRLLDSDDIDRLEERIHAEQSARTVIDAVNQLKPNARDALLLVGVEGLTPTEAAQVLGISPANFRMRLSAARRALDRSLQANAHPTTDRPTRNNQFVTEAKP